MQSDYDLGVIVSDVNKNQAGNWHIKFKLNAPVEIQKFYPTEITPFPECKAGHCEICPLPDGRQLLVTVLNDGSDSDGDSDGNSKGDRDGDSDGDSDLQTILCDSKNLIYQKKHPLKRLQQKFTAAHQLTHVFSTADTIYIVGESNDLSKENEEILNDVPNVLLL